MTTTDSLISLVGSHLDEIPDSREDNKHYFLSNNLRLSFSMFHLKDPSLSSFRGNFETRFANLHRIYGVEELPGDTSLRKSIDSISPTYFQQLFSPLIDVVQEHAVFDEFKVFDDYLVIPIDGSQVYCSGKSKCDSCLVKEHRPKKKKDEKGKKNKKRVEKKETNDEKIYTYYHQVLAAAIVHPSQKVVLPISVEAIVRQDGATKNDCELNAAKRLLPQIRQVLGKEQAIITVFDALYNNGPQIKRLEEQQMSYIIATKGSSFVDIQINTLKEQNPDNLSTYKWSDKKSDFIATFRNDLILNGQHQDIKVNYFSVKEIDKKNGKQKFYGTWITDLSVTKENVKELTQIARARWKIENETFNTLKNQGYHLEHNYGHGKKHLATNFAILTFIAFLVDQIALLLDKEFQKAKHICKTFKAFWERIRFVTYLLPTKSMNAVYRFIAKNQQIDIPLLE